MTSPSPLVRIVDDEPATRTALDRLLRAAGYRTAVFGSAAEFLASDLVTAPGCLVLDIHMPAMSGLELHQLLSKTDSPLPVIFLTCHGTIPLSVEAMKAGAVDFLTKPVEKADLLRAISQAVERDRTERVERSEIVSLRVRLSRLTPREHVVFQRVVAGDLNKQIAADLGTSEQNIKFHRGHVMSKMEAGSLADLVRMASRLGIG